MTQTTRLPECTASSPCRLYVAFELGSTQWTLGFASTPAERPRVRTIPAGDLAAVAREILTAKVRLGLPVAAAVQGCYEAGRDGFWLHRWLAGQGIANVVVESSSIEVNRRARRAKTDRLDVGRLLSLLMRWAQGERKVWSVVRVPSPEAEAARHLTREIDTVKADRKRLRNRVQGLLAAQGAHLTLGPRFLEQLADARTGDGHPLAAALVARLTREWAHLAAVDARLHELTALRDAAIAAGTDRVATVARTLCTMKGVASTSAAVLSAELFGTRTFENGRELGALTGLVPVPYRSDQMVHDQGISKAGRAELRALAVQLAWLWVRWQPDSALTQWFRRRFDSAGGRSRRVGIVALARKLLIALWRYVTHGVIPEGAVLKTATVAIE
jgi:transposase